MDTLVDPVETLSSSSMRAASPSEAPRGSFGSIDPDAEVQWFARVMDDDPIDAIDLEISWDEEWDKEPTLVIRRPGRPR